ncbi:type VI secretion system membrane subunit TssM [Vibrio alginolyticus]|nr:type VI secretion system membrane subunit TssM [Vibrio alginolyticus]MBY7710583.1 type VI secretion system membrane subunit TssM [Vibrio alginolyticus]
MINAWGHVKATSKAATPWLLVLSFMLLHVAIWWLGPMLEWQDMYPLAQRVHRIYASGVLCFIAALWWGNAYRKKVLEMQQTQQRNEELNNDPLLEVTERQEAEFEAVLQEMKSSIGQRALYAQPWYVMLGAAQSGKTHLIQRLGLPFSFSTVKQAAQETGENVDGFDWWVGNDAVIIDPAGPIITQDTSGDEKSKEGQVCHRRQWKHFIEWLEKTRRRRPLNGVIVAMDVAQLASQDENARLTYCMALRARLKELMDTVASRLPVYVVLTKFDLLYGFEPFFRYCTAFERESLLGFTFSVQTPEQADGWVSEFVADFDRFVAQLNGVLAQHATEGEDARAMFAFVKQMTGLKHGLKTVLENVFLRDKFSTPALLRGTYFTSIEQQGVPKNLFDAAASKHYGFDKQALPAQHAKHSAVYFVRSLFPTAILPESGLASDNVKVTKHKRRLMMHSAIACSLATLVLLLGWQYSYVNNVERADSVMTKVRLYQETAQQNTQSHQAMLDALAQIREAMLAFGYFHERPKYLADMGLYQGHKIGPKVEQTYLNLLETQFLPLLMNELMVELEQAQTNEDKLAALRVFRMLTDQSGRQNNVVMNHFAHIWHGRFTGQRETQEALLHHLQYALKHTNLEADKLNGDTIATDILRPYQPTVSRVQTELSQMPNEERVYRNLRASAQSVLGADLNLRQLVGPTFDVVFQTRQAHDERLFIPKFFSKDGFERYFLPQMRSVSTLALTDSWVLGQAQTTDFSDADKTALQEKIQALYIADYTRTWRDALNALDIQPFTQLDDAILVLDSLVSNTQPIQKLLRTLKSQTHLYTALPEDKAAQKALLTSTPFKISTAIESPFARLNALLTAEKGEESNVDQVLASIGELDNYLKSIQEAPDRGMAALSAVQARVGLTDADPIYTLKRISRGLPAPLDSLLEKVAQDSWYVVKQEAIQYLDVRWQKDIYAVFETQFAHRYPFDVHASKDVSLKDFEAFFAPEGTLESFYTEQLKGFVDESGQDANGQRIISADILNELDHAKRIQAAFFNRKGVLGVNFTVEPVSLSGNKIRSILDVDGQYLAYAHGPKENIEMIWPNTLRARATTKVTLMPNQHNVSPRSVVAQGPWALFHLLDKGALTGASETSVEHRFNVDGGAMVYRFNCEASVNPFTDHLLSDFTLARSLY